VSFSFQAVLFDLDGVLADSELLSNRIWVQLLADHGLTLTHDDFMARSVGLSLGVLYADLERDFGWKRPEHFDARSDAALAASFETVKAVPGALETLQALRRAGVSYAVASNSRRDRLDLKLRAAGLADLVQHSFDPSQVGGRGKPLPDLYQHAAASLGAEVRQCLVIEDSATGVQAGVAAGATVWGLLAGEHVSSALGSQLLAAGAARVFGSYARVREALGLEAVTSHPSGR
jgi:HAD superfamily hydrolase (TIGR01509 family)